MVTKLFNSFPARGQILQKCLAKYDFLKNYEVRQKQELRNTTPRLMRNSKSSCICCIIQIGLNQTAQLALQLF